MTMMKISRLLSTSVRHCTVLRTISSSCPHLAETSISETEPSKYDNYVTIVRQPAKYMRTKKYYQILWMWTVGGCWVVNTTAATLWQVYEPLTFGTCSNVAAGASLLTIFGITTQFLSSKTLGKVSIDQESNKVLVSRLDFFGNRIDKEFNAAQCYFKATKLVEICSLPDGKYTVVWKESNPEDIKLLLTMTAKGPVSTDRLDPDKKKSYIYSMLILNTTVGLSVLLSLKVLREEYKKQQVESKTEVASKTKDFVS